MPAPDAPAIPTQTPGLFVKAGAIGNFSADCEALLAKCGYEPDDFGSHAYNQKRINDAKEKCRVYDEQAAAAAAAKKDPPPDPPSEKERFLAHCTSGHLSQDALYHRPPDKGRAENDPCLNHTPGGPRGGDARGYHPDMAPTIPLLTGQQGSSVALDGSPHKAVDEAEKRQANQAIAAAKEQQQVNPPKNESEATAKVSQDQLASNAKENASLALHEGKDPASLPAEHQPVLAAKKAAVVPAPPGEAGAAKGAPADAKKDEKKQEFTGQTAADCVESFRKAMMKHMREEAVRNHGTPEAHADTQQKAQARVDKAKENLKAAEAKQKERGVTERQNERRITELEQKAKAQARQGKTLTEEQQKELDKCVADRHAMREEQRTVDRGRADVKDAETQLRAGECMRQQVESMQREGNTNPDWQGVVPGWPASEQSGAPPS